MVRQCASTAASIVWVIRMQSAPTSPCGWRSLKALKARISPSPKSWRRNDISQRYVLTISRNMYLYYLVLAFRCIYYNLIFFCISRISLESAPEPFHQAVSKAHCTN